MTKEIPNEGNSKDSVSHIGHSRAEPAPVKTGAGI
jgi:hypothetical protein